MKDSEPIMIGMRFFYAVISAGLGLGFLFFSTAFLSTTISLGLIIVSILMLPVLCMATPIAMLIVGFLSTTTGLAVIGIASLLTVLLIFGAPGVIFLIFGFVLLRTIYTGHDNNARPHNHKTRPRTAKPPRLLSNSLTMAPKTMSTPLSNASKSSTGPVLRRQGQQSSSSGSGSASRKQKVSPGTGTGTTSYDVLGVSEDESQQIKHVMYRQRRKSDIVVLE